MGIKDWPAAERPREKLLQRGAPALSDAELLAIFLRTGVSGKSAVDLARELLNRFGIFGPPTIAFFDTSGQELRAFRQVGFAPADEFSVHIQRFRNQAP